MSYVYSFSDPRAYVYIAASLFFISSSNQPAGATATLEIGLKMNVTSCTYMPAGGQAEDRLHGSDALKKLRGVFCRTRDTKGIGLCAVTLYLTRKFFTCLAGVQLGRDF